MQTKEKSVLIFGASSYGKALATNLPSDEYVIAYLDNDKLKQGKYKDGFPVLSPDDLPQDFERIYIAAGATQEIYRQILSLGVSEDKIYRPHLFSPENIEKLNSFKNKHKYESVVIVGNGPSLTTNDLDKISAKGMVSFAFNKIYLAFEESSFRPTYYMVEDILVAENNQDKINNLNGFTKFYADYSLRYLRENADTVLFGLRPSGLGGGPSFEVDFSTNPFEFHDGGTVAYSALQMSLYMGFSKIYLLGVDFNFKESDADPNGVNILVNADEQNHFHPDYRKPNEKWTKPNMELSQAAYELALRRAEEVGVEIINLTRGGELEVFERGSFDRVFL